MNKLSIIGAGAMGQAIAKGLVEAKLYKAGEIMFFDLRLDLLEGLERQYGYAFAESFDELISELEPGSSLLFAVKPQNIDQVLQDIPKLDSSILLISILAGTKISKYQERFPQNPIIRVMPNTPAQILKGASALATSANCSEQNIKNAKAMFDALGLAVVVEEQDLDLVTALSGSGPAYVFYLIEAMADSAIKLGMSKDIAKSLAMQTVYGAACLAKDSGKQPSELRAQVTSPNGTTSAGIDSLEKNGFKETVFRAIAAAEKRSKELN